MTWFNNVKRRAFLALLLPVSILITMALPAQPVQAGGEIAMSGTFYLQDFEIPRGVKVANKSIYVVVFNQGDSEFTVHLTPSSPKEVELSLSEQDFLLQPEGQRKVYIGVGAGEDAVPGEYTLTVTAEARHASSEGGIQIIAAVAQEARLKITGEAAWISARVVSPLGDAVVATVSLFKETQGVRHEFASSETGVLEAKVSLGRYIVCAYVGGEKLAEEVIDITTENERKEVTLVVKTAYFANFGIVPNYYTKTHELAFATIVYQLRNLYQPMNDIKLILKVRDNDEALEEVPLLSLSQLALGDISGSRDYTPPGGWQSGSYTFQAELSVGGKLYASTLEEKLEVPAAPAPAVSWKFLGGILSATVVIIVVMVSRILARRRHAVRSLGHR
jgi:hypothetical protein